MQSAVQVSESSLFAWKEKRRIRSGIMTSQGGTGATHTQTQHLRLAEGSGKYTSLPFSGYLLVMELVYYHQGEVILMMMMMMMTILSLLFLSS